jgi:hypothetical protein
VNLGAAGRAVKKDSVYEEWMLKDDSWYNIIIAYQVGELLS